MVDHLAVLYFPDLLVWFGLNGNEDAMVAMAVS
jgi:hypothetical protein